MQALSGIVGFLAVTMFVSSASAQTRQTSSIAGVVRDATGGALPGVTVEAASPALIQKVATAISDAEGRYQLPDLRPGSYTVTFSLPGFATVIREGVELQTNFTATINAELKIGGLEETITVSGASPIVDVETVAQRAVISDELIQAVPMARGFLGFGGVVPSIVIPANFQDVGGSQGEASTRMSVHGSKAGDQKLMIDGMRFTSTAANGAGRFIFVNPASTEEVAFDLSAAGSAEYASGGVQMNLVSKSGSNQFQGYFFTEYSDNGLQSNNLTEDLQARGLRSTTQVLEVYDVNGAFGGPLKRDSLWFFTAHRVWGGTYRWANQFENSDVTSPIYVADLSRPSESPEKHWSDNIRLTWQATPRHRFTFFADKQVTLQPFNSSQSVGLASPEAISGVSTTSNAVIQGTWNYQATNRLYFEAGWNVTLLEFAPSNNYGIWPTPESVDQEVSILEQTTNYRYRAASTYVPQQPGQTNQRFSVSYMVGAHNLKAGLFMMENTHQQQTFTHPSGLNYTFQNGAPISLTQYVTPQLISTQMRPELGLYLQDQWHLGRLSLNLGVRFDYLRIDLPANDQPAGPFTPARSFDAVTCVPCWSDLNPRVSASYDLFGTGKTAVKASIGRFGITEASALGIANHPVTTSVNQVNRAWTDTNRDFVPDCDLRTSAANDECGQMSNANFGQSRITTRSDHDVLNGWHHRPNNWQASVQFQHELAPGIALDAGYFRTWYGNFTVTDNLAVTSSDYDPYCITAPADSRLPGGGGNEICGLYDINPSKFGQVNNLVTFASNYGQQTEIYNGFDLSLSTRLRGGAMLGGGINVGNSNISGAFVTLSSNRRCFVVDSPQELYQCDQPVPYRAQAKIHGSVPLPWNLQVSANFQSLPGPAITATYNVPTAAIAPSLGRNLAGGARTVAVQIVQPFTMFEERINQLDLRLTKTVRVKRTTVKGIMDVYNSVNASSVLAMNTTYGATWLAPRQVLGPRLIKFGVEVQF